MNGQKPVQLKTKDGTLQGSPGRLGAEGKPGTKGEKVRLRCAH